MSGGRFALINAARVAETIYYCMLRDMCHAYRSLGLHRGLVLFRSMAQRSGSQWGVPLRLSLARPFFVSLARAVCAQRRYYSNGASGQTHRIPDSSCRGAGR